jgi:hypothetical protein
MEHKFQPYIVDISKFKNTEPNFLTLILDIKIDVEGAEFQVLNGAEGY